MDEVFFFQFGNIATFYLRDLLCGITQLRLLKGISSAGTQQGILLLCASYTYRCVCVCAQHMCACVCVYVGLSIKLSIFFM